MSKYLFLGLLLCGFTICAAQSLPTKKEQLNFLKWYITHRRLVPLNDTITSFPNEFLITADINGILSTTKQSKINRKYIERQAHLLKYQITLDTATLKKLQWDKTRTAKGEIINYMSLPVFSLDRKLVIVQYGYYCGNLCGKERTDVYIKDKNNKWVPANIITVIEF